MRGKFQPKLEMLEDRWCPSTSGIDGYDLAGLGNSPSTAVNLGTASSNQSLVFSQNNLSIHAPNETDYYKFKIEGTPAANDKLTVNFVNVNGDIDIRLYELKQDGSIFQVDTSLSTTNTETINLSNKPAGTYVLRVYCTDDGTNNYSLALNINPTGAAAPTQTFPTLNATGVNGQVADLRPELSWTQSVGALGYQIWVDDLTAGKSNLFPTAFSAGAWTPPSDLISGHTYRWWVRGVAVNGQTYPWSHSQDFTVSTVQFTPLTGPLNDLYPNIPWTGVNNAVSYKIWVDNLTTGQTNIFANGFTGFIGENGWDLLPMAKQALTSGHTYKIWVKAANADGEGSWSSPQTFTVGAIQFAKPLTAVGDLMPTIPFTPIAGSPSATVWLDDLTTGQTNLFPNQPLTGNAWTPPANLTVGHSYRIWGQALSPANNGTGWWGPAMDFKINAAIYAIPPATTLRPSLNWSKITGVANYEVWVADAANGVNLTPGFTTMTTNWVPNFDLISGHRYNIWVRAQGGVWSDVQTFEIQKVTEIKATKVMGAYEIAWTPLSLVTDYELWIDDLTTKATNIIPGLVVGQPGMISKYGAKYTMSAALTNGHTYRVWIKARNAAGLGEWSNSFDFAAP